MENVLIVIVRLNIEKIHNFLEPGLQDLCVSRTTFDWGVKVPFNDKHVVYVWIDALSNYITNIGYDVDGGNTNFQKWWPADLHLIGKDIVRFHTIYWPILLMALDLPLPKQIFGHPWLLMGNDKMSKSKGNIMYADDLVNLFGVDAIRYYVLHEIPFANDGTITYELIMERINTDLVNILGNLVNRTITMAHKYFNGAITNEKVVNNAINHNYIAAIVETSKLLDEKMTKLEVGASLDVIFDLLRKSNKYIDETAPWVLAKDENSRDLLECVLYNLLEGIRVGAVLLSSFLPDTSKEILRQLNTDDETDTFNFEGRYQLNEAKILFQRLDIDAKMKEINSNAN